MAPLSTGAAQTAVQERTATAEPHLPRGKLLQNVQPHPIPLTTAHAVAAPVVTDDAARQQVAGRERSELTGTGGIVDIIV